MWWAPLGLGEMLNSGGAVVEAGELLDSPGGGAQVTLRCRGPGRLHAYSQPAPTQLLLAGEPLPFRHDASSGLLIALLPDDVSTASLSVRWDGARAGGGRGR